MGRGSSRRFTDRDEWALPIEHGEVMCPRRGVIDVEECWVCRDYRGLSTGRFEALVCGATSQALASAVWALDNGPEART